MIFWELDSCSSAVIGEKCLNSCRKNDSLYVFIFIFTKLNNQYKVLSKVSSLSSLIFKNQPRIVLSMSFNFFQISDLCFYRNCLIKKCIHIFRYFYTRLLCNFVIFWKNIVKDPICTIADCFSVQREILKFQIIIIYGFAAIHFQSLLFLESKKAYKTFPLSFFVFNIMT